VKALFGRVVFSVGTEEYCWEDVVLDAQIRGEWTLLQDRLRRGIACLHKMEEGENCLTDEEIESAATEFRYSRDLVSAQDMEEWLARWNLTAEGWMDYVRWSLLRQKLSDEPPDLTSEQPADDEADLPIQVEAVCSGDLERFANDLAGRAAIHEKEKNRTESDGADVSEVLRQFPVRLREEGLAGISREACRAKLERLARVELTFRRFREQALKQDAIARLIRSRRIEWTRVDFDSLSFTQEEAAREAALCVREDGKNLRDVADSAGRELHRETMYVGELDPALGDRFLASQKGELVGPLESGEEFVLYHVRDKILPSENDVKVVARAQAAALKLQLDGEINDRVKWAARA
jgi:hypothetical protein